MTPSPPHKDTNAWKVPPYQHINSPLSSPVPQSTSDPHTSPPPSSPQQWTCLTPTIAASQPKAYSIGWNHGNRLGMGGEWRWMDGWADNKATCFTFSCANVSSCVIFPHLSHIWLYLHGDPPWYALKPLAKNINKTIFDFALSPSNYQTTSNVSVPEAHNYWVERTPCFHGTRMSKDY